MRNSTAKPDLMDQGGGLERVAGGFVGHLVRGELAQLRVDQGE